VGVITESNRAKTEDTKCVHGRGKDILIGKEEKQQQGWGISRYVMRIAIL
jgi:hypothetical protein